MADLTLKEQKWYSDNMNRQGEEGAAFVVNSLRNSDLEDIADIRNGAIELAQSVVKIKGDNAQIISNELFDSIMEREGSNKTAGFYDDIYDDDYIEDYIRYITQHLVDDEPEIFYEKLGEMVDYMIRRAGFEGMFKNCKRNRVRYARIPHGSNPCAFCLMLAGRGFVYHSEESAGGDSPYHLHCHCTVVPSTDGNLNVEGYSEYVQDYERQYDLARKEARDAMEGFDTLDTDTKMKAILEKMRKMYNIN